MPPLNQGMPITSIQRLLGHDRLETTMIYAHVHDETVLQDFEQASADLSRASLLTEQPSSVESLRIAIPAKEVNCV